MNFAPLLNASPVIQIHAAAAIAALLLGAVVLFRRKGDSGHRALGRLWVGVMVVAALSSFFIWTIRLWGLFSPIHLLSLLTLAMLYRGVSYARRHQIGLHRRTMQTTYLLALVGAGLFTFFPGRIMYKVAFGPAGADPEKLVLFALALMLVGGLTVLVGRLSGRSGRGSASGRRPSGAGGDGAPTSAGP